MLPGDCQRTLEQKVRITFETDADDDYFRRSHEAGTFSLLVETKEGLVPAQNVLRPRLNKGLARITYELPEGVSVGEQLSLIAEIDDPSRLEPFINRITLRVKPERQVSPGTKGQNRSGGNTKGEDKGGKDSGQDSSSESTFGIPIPIIVEEKDWDKQNPPFTKFTAVRIIQRSDAPDDSELFDFDINIDNGYLKGFIKDKPSASKTMKQRFSVGMTLVSLSLLHHEQLAKKATDKGEEFPKEDSAVQGRVTQTTSALAPFLLPMLEVMDKIQLDEDKPLSDSAGEAA